MVEVADIADTYTHECKLTYHTDTHTRHTHTHTHKHTFGTHTQTPHTVTQPHPLFFVKKHDNLSSKEHLLPALFNDGGPSLSVRQET